MLPNFKKSDTEPPKPGSALPSGAPMSRPMTSLRGSSAPSIISPDLTISGNLYSKGEIQIEGEVQGDVHSTHVIVGEKARITGGIIAEEVVIRGHVMGSVRGKRVLLQATSHVEGDIYHQTLAIEQNAFFEGKSRRTEDPTAGLIRPDQLPAGSALPAAAAPAPVASGVLIPESQPTG
jgi:cytoskeletal protein CcmA (bactofilin family)